MTILNHVSIGQRLGRSSKLKCSVKSIAMVPRNIDLGIREIVEYTCIW